MRRLPTLVVVLLAVSVLAAFAHTRPPAPRSPVVTLNGSVAPGDSVRLTFAWGAVQDVSGKPVVRYLWRVRGGAAGLPVLLQDSTTAGADTAQVALLAGDSVRVEVAARDRRGTLGAYGLSPWLVRRWGPPPAPPVTVDTLAVASVRVVVTAASIVGAEAGWYYPAAANPYAVEVCVVSYNALGSPITPRTPATLTASDDGLTLPTTTPAGDTIVAHYPLVLGAQGPSGRDCRWLELLVPDSLRASLAPAQRRDLRQALVRRIGLPIYGE